jgi:hypothetical protein
LHSQVENLNRGEYLPHHLHHLSNDLHDHVLSHQHKLEIDYKANGCSLDTHGNDQLSVGQISIEISKASPPFSDFHIKGNGSKYEEKYFQKISNIQEVQKEDYIYPYVPFISMSEEKGEYDEVHGDIFSNLFQDPIADNSMQEYSSLSLEIFPDVPIFDKYSDEEEYFKSCEGLLTTRISSSPTFQQRDDQRCMHVVVNDSYEDFTVVANIFHYDRYIDDIRDVNHHIDSFNIVPNASIVLGCHKDQIVPFEKLKNDEQILYHHMTNLNLQQILRVALSFQICIKREITTDMRKNMMSSKV